MTMAPNPTRTAANRRSPSGCFTIGIQRIVYLTPALPEWAKPIAAVALNQARQYGKE
jgi:hypothetical protein